MSAQGGANYTFRLKGVIDSSFQKAKQSANELGDKIKDAGKGMNFKLPDGIKNTFKGIGDSVGGASEKLSGFAKDIPVVGEGLSSITSKLGPVGLAITATVGAVVALGSHLVGLTHELEGVRQNFSLFVHDAKELDKVTAKAQGLKKVFGTSEEEIAKAANTLQKEFGISSVEAIDKLQKAMVATNGKLELGDINEFANQIKNVGGNADSLLTTMSTSVQNGLFSNKSLDAMKDFGKNINSGSDSVKDILKTVGKGDIMDKVQKGILTGQEAYKEIYKDFDKYTLKQQQELTTLLGGGGEALGKKGIQSLATMNDSLDGLVDKAGEYAKHTQERLELEEQLASEQLKSTNQIAPILKKIEVFSLKLKIAFQQMINPLVSGFMKVGQWIKSIGIGLTRLYDFLSNALGKAFDKIFGEGTTTKIKTFFNTIFSIIGDKWSQFTEMISQSFEAIRLAIEGNYKDAGIAFDKAKQAGKELFSMSKKRYGATDDDENKSDNTSADANDNINNNADNFGADATNNIKNGVSGATSEVKNIDIHLGSLQNIQNQYLQSSEDIKKMQAQLQQALLQITNDANQTGSN